jgi:hypothetical protein
MKESTTKSAKEERFETFLASIILVNAAERYKWLFNVLNNDKAWPLDVLPLKLAKQADKVAAHLDSMIIVRVQARTLDGASASQAGNPMMQRLREFMHAIERGEVATAAQAESSTYGNANSASITQPAIANGDNGGSYLNDVGRSFHKERRVRSQQLHGLNHIDGVNHINRVNRTCLACYRYFTPLVCDFGCCISFSVLLYASSTC